MHHARGLSPDADSGEIKTPVRREVAREAAHWLTLIHAGEADSEVLAACSNWRAADPEHERAWQRAEMVSRRLGLIPTSLGLVTLDRKRRFERRVVIKALLAAVIAAPPTYLGYRAASPAGWGGDYRTAVGERDDVWLADGTRIHLNSASAIDVVFDDSLRRVVLRAGEVLIETAPDESFPGSAPRPFVVDTAQGRVRALGTRFIVRREPDDATRVSVFAGAVEILPHASGSVLVRLRAGEQARFDAVTVDAPAPVDQHAADWTRGMLTGLGMPLGEFAAELARHRRGVLRCDPAVAQLRITGAFRLDDTDAILAALPETLPVDVVYRTRWWVNIVSRRSI